MNSPHPDRIARLEQTVRHLADTIGKRSGNEQPDALTRAQRWLEERLAALGNVRSRPVHAGPHPILELRQEGSDPRAPILVVGAHYDTVSTTPGADDNASGCAAVLELAEAFSERAPRRTILWTLWPYEEPPYFGTAAMGSYAHASALRSEGVQIEVAISIESIGFFPDEPLDLPSELVDLLGGPDAIPDHGRFIVLTGDPGCKGEIAALESGFRRRRPIDLLARALPVLVPGVMDSDHWAFRQHGYPAVMFTDAPPYRNPHYHRPTDRPDTLDFDSLARVVDGIEDAVASLA